MFWLTVAGASVLIVLLATYVIWRWLRSWGGEVQAERARELFRLQRERIEHQFLPAAAATGKPRGLRWIDCDFEGPALFARDRATRQVIALISCTIRFEAVEGSDMEGLPAVGNLRNASAVFFFEAGQWRTAGKVVFNLNPSEALAHFHGQYEPMPTSTERPK